MARQYAFLYKYVEIVIVYQYFSGEVLPYSKRLLSMSMKLGGAIYIHSIYTVIHERV